MKNVFITGVAGFIGFHTAQRLLSEGCNVMGIDNMSDYYDVTLKEARLNILLKHPQFSFWKADINDTERLIGLFKGTKFDVVCHLAGQAGVRDSIDHPFNYIDINIRGTNSLFEAMVKTDHKKVVYASSSSVYGKYKDVDQPASLYGLTKRVNELQAFYYKELYGLESIGLRFFTVYGPYGRPDMAIFGFTKKIMEGSSINVYNHGELSRDFTYVSDIVDGIFKSLLVCSEGTLKENPDKSPVVFDLGKGSPDKLMDMITLLGNKIDLPVDMNFVEMQAGDVLETKADIEPAKVALGYSPKVPLHEGIDHFVDWYKVFYTKK